ncbi:MAG: macro domain-containing protein [Proteobacteria bacterium]|nr:macro domain-containing protein [Pseudomonadota bacterium]
METLINQTRLILKTGDITLEDTDAIVNAANSRLAGGGGVDGAIHKAGGGEIMRECVGIGSCPTGEAVITTGGRLKAAHVIHTVGPVYRGGFSGEGDLLKSAYLSSLSLALNSKVKSISFPSISTGTYGFPVEEASAVALKAIIEFIKSSVGLREIRFILFSEHDLKVYEKSLASLITPQKQ